MANELIKQTIKVGKVQHRKSALESDHSDEGITTLSAVQQLHQVQIKTKTKLTDVTPTNSIESKKSWKIAKIK